MRSQWEKRYRRTLWGLLVLSLMLCLAAGIALAEEADACVAPGEEGAAVSEGGLSNEAAMRGYLQQILQEAKRGETRVNGTWVQNRLSGPSLRMCQYMRERIGEIAAGKINSTIFRIPVTAVNDQISFTAKELGVDRIVNPGGRLNEKAEEAFLEKVKPDFLLVVPALLADCPYELYWYDKTIGYHFSYPGFEYDSGKIWYRKDAVFELRMTVAEEYAAWGGASSYETSATQVKAAKTAVANAKKIVQENQGKDDVAKLRAYKNIICELTEYNDEATRDRDRDYGNPWQLIWVFDGDPETNVVCEGYAKAFQYLCDLSTFRGKIEVTTVTGQSNGNHMWNMVKMPDGKRYLADVTNCDEGQTGYPDYLFLAGYSAVFDIEGSKEYCYSCGAWDSCYYIFNTEPQDLFAVETENLSTKAYNEITVGDGIYSLDRKTSTATLIDVAKSNLKTLTVENAIHLEGETYKVTAIGDEALRERRQLTTVTIGKYVTSIGKDAFRGCKKLKTIIFAGTKLEKIGKGAFIGIKSKATFELPGKKYGAYKKKILAAGAPEESKFKKK